MSSVTIDPTLILLGSYPLTREKFMSHLNNSIQIFKAKYLEVFGKVINDDQMRVINGGLGGYSIQSLKGKDLTASFTTEENGLEIKWSGYRDVYNRSDVPEFPYRQADIVYKNGKRTNATEYNIDGNVLLQITWDETNSLKVIYENQMERSRHAPKAFDDIPIPYTSMYPTYLLPYPTSAKSLTGDVVNESATLDYTSFREKLSDGLSLRDALKAATLPTQTKGGAGSEK